METQTTAQSNVSPKYSPCCEAVKTMNKSTLVLIALFCSAFRTQSQQTPRLPEVSITENQADGTLAEEARIGPNEQPEWTAQRRFGATRVYVLPPFQLELEQWWEGKFPKHGKPYHLFQTEAGIGLPYRFQLDLYENLERTSSGTFRHQGNQVELRWALAEWGRIPLNPTLYGEWKFNHDAADAYEVKLLLGEELAPRWHWGLNGIFEREIGGERETEIAVSQAIGYTVIDQTLNAGIEMKAERTSGPALNGKPEFEFLIGPSVQWRPWRNAHLDIVPLFGATHDSPRVEAFIIFGIGFGLHGESQQVAPSSLRSR
jgi:hypothetical protein